MISIATLWLPVLLSAVAIFAVSSVMHMFLSYHHGDLRKMPGEAAILDALRGLKIPPGDYALPKSDSMQHMRSAEYAEKIKRGPVVLLNLSTNGTAMGKSLAQWFGYLLLVGLCCAYIASRELVAGATYAAVFRLTGFAAFMAYALGWPQNSIWYRRNWRMTLWAMLDGLVFALLTGGMFGWLWPR